MTSDQCKFFLSLKMFPLFGILLLSIMCKAFVFFIWKILVFSFTFHDRKWETGGGVNNKPYFESRAKKVPNLCTGWWFDVQSFCLNATIKRISQNVTLSNPYLSNYVLLFTMTSVQQYFLQKKTLITLYLVSFELTQYEGRTIPLDLKLRHLFKITGQFRLKIQKHPWYERKWKYVLLSLNMFCFSMYSIMKFFQTFNIALIIPSGLFYLLMKSSPIN